MVTTLVLAEKCIQPRLALVQEMDSAVVLLLAKVDNWSNRGLSTIVGPPLECACSYLILAPRR